MTDRQLIIMILAALAVVSLVGAIVAGAAPGPLLAVVTIVVGVLVPSPLSKTSTAPDSPTSGDAAP